MNAYILINNSSIEIIKSAVNTAHTKATHIEVQPPYVSAYMNEKSDWYWYQKQLGAWVYCFDKSVQRVSINELNQALKDFSLIEEFGGLEPCREIAKELEGYVAPTYMLCIMLLALERVEEGLNS